MHIELLPAPQCFVTDLVGDLHDATPIRAGQTRLILAKISLEKSRPTSSNHSASSADLFADLETHLGDACHPYLTVRLSYKHSGFQNTKIDMPGPYDKGSSVTHLQTDVVSMIKRHDKLSVWSPRASQAAILIPNRNPLIEIVRQHLPSNETIDIIAKLVSDNLPYPYSRQPFKVEGSGNDIVIPPDHLLWPRASSIIHTSSYNFVDTPEEPLTRSQSVQNVINPFIRFPDPPRTLSDETDPARKIWCEMRRSSRGRHSINDEWRCFSKDEYVEDDLTPKRKLSSVFASSNFDGASFRENSEQSARYIQGNSVEYERNMIMEIALKNKRSLGAETLRSMAPSIAKSTLKSKAGTVGGLGLGSGRTWG
jgi:hypothetical protein